MVISIKTIAMLILILMMRCCKYGVGVVMRMRMGIGNLPFSPHIDEDDGVVVSIFTRAARQVIEIPLGLKNGRKLDGHSGVR